MYGRLELPFWKFKFTLLDQFFIQDTAVPKNLLNSWKTAFVHKQTYFGSLNHVSMILAISYIK